MIPDSCTLYLVTDSELTAGRPLPDVVRAAVEGGVRMVQLREKSLSTRAFVAQAEQLSELLIPYNVPLIINDRLDVALAVGATGLHIGQSDMPYPIARQLLGANKIIGLSVSTLAELQEANAWDVDYVAASPVFDTPTKTDYSRAIGLDGLAQFRAATHHRLVAIGGINANNVLQVVQAGAHDVAVVSAISMAPDPRRAAEMLCQRMSG